MTVVCGPDRCAFSLPFEDEILYRFHPQSRTGRSIVGPPSAKFKTTSSVPAEILPLKIRVALKPLSVHVQPELFLRISK